MTTFSFSFHFTNMDILCGSVLGSVDRGKRSALTNVGRHPSVYLGPKWEKKEKYRERANSLFS